MPPSLLQCKPITTVCCLVSSQSSVYSKFFWLHVGATADLLHTPALVVPWIQCDVEQRDVDS